MSIHKHIYKKILPENLIQITLVASIVTQIENWMKNDHKERIMKNANKEIYHGHLKS